MERARTWYYAGMRIVLLLPGAVALAVACGGPPQAGSASAAGPIGRGSSLSDQSEPTTGSGPPARAPGAPAAEVALPSAQSGDDRLTIPEARRYMVTLINRDRATLGLLPVTLDEGPPTVAGQAHADDMATHGYLGHWGTDGSVPEQRLTEAGGADMVLENASCFFDEKTRTLDPAPTVGRKHIDLTEHMFFDEKPPHDGHRKNILKPAHKRVGIGIAQPVSTATEIAVPCFSQEFIDPYGTYASVPARMKAGQVLHVEGDVRSPATIGGVGLARMPTPRPLSAAEANKRRSYPIPQPYQSYWPQGFRTPIPLAVTGEHFAIDVPVSDGGQPGLYEISVWAKMPNSADFVSISLRTIRVER